LILNVQELGELGPPWGTAVSWFDHLYQKCRTFNVRRGSHQLPLMPYLPQFMSATGRIFPSKFSPENV